MQVIWKFEIKTDDVIKIKMPEGAKILTIDSQHTIPCIWALCDPIAKVETRKFIILGTGHPIEDTENLKYIGTYQMYGGDLIFHVFEEKE
jgi:hypothetical protein